jgi:hypothetical protein
MTPYGRGNLPLNFMKPFFVTVGYWEPKTWVVSIREFWESSAQHRGVINDGRLRVQQFN